MSAYSIRLTTSAPLITNKQEKTKQKIDKQSSTDKPTKLNDKISNRSRLSYFLIPLFHATTKY